MSKLDRMYNWNGEYKLLKDLEDKIYKVSNLDYPEFFYIFTNNEDDTIRYSIIDENFGMPCLANTENTEHALELRTKSIEVLDYLELKGYIEKI